MSDFESVEYVIVDEEGVIRQLGRLDRQSFLTLQGNMPAGLMYEVEELGPSANLQLVDPDNPPIDRPFLGDVLDRETKEIKRFPPPPPPEPVHDWRLERARAYPTLSDFLEAVHERELGNTKPFQEWVKKCNEVKARIPKV